MQSLHPSAVELRAALDRLPRLSLGHLPTPLEPCPRLSRTLGDVEIWLKRDDATGLALGGNKARHLEFHLAAAREREADCIVIQGASTSNYCRQTAAACARLGLDATLVLRRDARAERFNGNLLLDHLFGPRIVWADAPTGPELQAARDAEAERLRAAGRKPYVIDHPLGGVAYVDAFLELQAQLEERGIAPHSLYVCSAGPTLAGLLLAARLLAAPYRVVGISPAYHEVDLRERVAGIANAAAELLGVPAEVPPEAVRIDEGYVGPGYAIPTPQGRAAIELTARTEGILLDPVYTGKAMAGMIDHLRRGAVPAGATLVFIHTGGTPALFAYAEELV